MVASLKPVPKAALAGEVGTLLGQGRRCTWQAAAQRLEEQGESVYVWNLLHHLNLKGPLTQRELATATSQHPAGVSRLLEEVEAQGLVRRRREASDRRKFVVELTAKGQRKRQRCYAHVVEAAAHALSGL